MRSSHSEVGLPVFIVQEIAIQAYKYRITQNQLK